MDNTYLIDEFCLNIDLPKIIFDKYNKPSNLNTGGLIFLYFHM